FQAEDGIRDGHVTGVQTCALPILRAARIWRGVQTFPLCRGAAGSAVGSSPGQYPVSSAYSIRASAAVSVATGFPAVLPQSASSRSEERRVGKGGRAARPPVAWRDK